MSNVTFCFFSELLCPMFVFVFSELVCPMFVLVFSEHDDDELPVGGTSPAYQSLLYVHCFFLFSVSTVMISFTS